MTYETIVDQLMQNYTSSKYEEEVNSARKDFFERAGMFDERSNDFEMKLAQFSDWYIFSRPSGKTGLTPIRMALEGIDYDIPQAERSIFESLANGIHSIFEFSKLKGNDLYLKDLFSGQKYILKDSNVTLGFNKDEVFEARLIPQNETYVFGKAFCFHPPSAKSFILKEIKKVKKSGDTTGEGRQRLIIRLFKMRYKHEQYKHVELKEIYSNESKLRL